MVLADTCNDFINDDGHKLNIGQLKCFTEHGKKPLSFVDHVPPRDIKAALCLLINLFLEQDKVPN